jgi:hypothetical protein
MAATYRSSATSNLSGVCNKPTGTAQDDILVGFVIGTAAITAPSGWVTLNAGNFSSVFYWMGYKVAGGSEPASYTWTNAASFIGVEISAYSGGDITTPTNGTATFGNNGAAGPTYAIPSIITTVGNVVLVECSFIYYISGDGGGVDPPTGFTERSEHNPAAATYYLETADSLQASAGASGTKTVTANPTGATMFIFAGMVGLTPGVTAPVILAPTLTGTGSMNVPDLAVVIAGVPLLSGTGSWLNPTLLGAVTLMPPKLTGTGTLLAPSVGVPAVIAAPLLSGSGVLLLPSPAGDATIAPPLLSGSGGMQIPVITAEALLDAPTLSGVGVLLEPTLTAEAIINAAIMQGYGVLLPPKVAAALFWIPYRGKTITSPNSRVIIGRTQNGTLGVIGTTHPPQRGPKRNR